jgi:DUF4097 and DUF4098 domain-containing protein YvlB
MNKFPKATVCGILVLGTALALAADSTRQARLTVAADGVVNVVNNCGSVTIHQGGQRQVVVKATTHSDKVEVDTSNTPDGKRVEIRTHALPDKKPSSDESRVDYDITVPSGVSVSISTATAPITLENVSGDVSLSSDTGSMTMKNATNSYIHIRGVAAPIVLTSITGHVEVTSSGGSVQLSNVSGPKVIVGTSSGNITYQGDFSGGGSYSLTTHSGAIDVTLPESASVDLTARSLTGSVENDYPLQTKSHLTFVPSQGRSFAGTSNSGSSSVELQSFSGKIRVKKQ